MGKTNPFRIKLPEMDSCDESGSRSPSTHETNGFIGNSAKLPSMQPNSGATGAEQQPSHTKLSSTFFN